MLFNIQHQTLQILVNRPYCRLQLIQHSCPRRQTIRLLNPTSSEIKQLALMTYFLTAINSKGLSEDNPLRFVYSTFYSFISFNTNCSPPPSTRTIYIPLSNNETSNTCAPPLTPLSDFRNLPLISITETR